MSRHLGGRRPPLPEIAGGAVILVLATLDMLADRAEGAGWEHLAAEGAIALFAAVGILLAGARLRDVLRERRRLDSALQTSRQEAERWRRVAESQLAELRESIEAQLERWGLTEAEAEVTVELLKGRSHKQIAATRGTSERTVRQQAHAVYRKAGLADRADLAAFFLGPL